MLVEESKLSLERAAVAEIEGTALLVLDWKIPNFSIRH